MKQKNIEIITLLKEIVKKVYRFITYWKNFLFLKIFLEGGSRGKHGVFGYYKR